MTATLRFKALCFAARVRGVVTPDREPPEGFILSIDVGPNLDARVVYDAGWIPWAMWLAGDGREVRAYLIPEDPAEQKWPDDLAVATLKGRPKAKPAGRQRGRFLVLCAAARVRGLLHHWPSRPDTPTGFGGVSCALNGPGECHAMFMRGWIPWCFHRDFGGVMTRFFIVPLTQEELAYQNAMRACSRSFAESMRELEGKEYRD